MYEIGIEIVNYVSKFIRMSTIGSSIIMYTLCVNSFESE